MPVNEFSHHRNERKSDISASFGIVNKEKRKLTAKEMGQHFVGRIGITAIIYTVKSGFLRIAIVKAV